MDRTACTRQDCSGGVAHAAAWRTDVGAGTLAAPDAPGGPRPRARAAPGTRPSATWRAIVVERESVTTPTDHHKTVKETRARSGNTEYTNVCDQVGSYSTAVTDEPDRAARLARASQGSCLIVAPMAA